METIAVYWEENIKTYGIKTEGDLSLVQADVRPSSLAAMGRQLAELGRHDAPVRLILAHHYTPAALRLTLVFADGCKDRLTEFCSQEAFTGACQDVRIDSPVEMLNFHGPHFGDRYGIANMAGDALKKEKIQFITIGCSAASVHIVFPENTADKAQKALKTVFKTP